MEEHHRQTIRNVIEHFETDPEVLALLLGGSIAHGFATPASDVDIMIVVPDDVFARRVAENRIHFYSRELSTYAGGYVDGKYHGLTYLDEVRRKGSEPARYAFADARILLSRDPSIERILPEIARYPREQKDERIGRFYAQFEAWHWYAREAVRHRNAYLLTTAVSKVILFGGRLILAHNETLYPYHKWFLRVLSKAPEKPDGLMDKIDTLTSNPTAENVESFYETVKTFREWGAPPAGWPTQFMHDSELTWLHGRSAVDDI